MVGGMSNRTTAAVVSRRGRLHASLLHEYAASRLKEI